MSRYLAEQVAHAALHAAQPKRAVREHLCVVGDELLIDDHRYPLTGRVCVIALGKAAHAMTDAVVDAGLHVDACLVISKFGPVGPDSVVGDHPLPGVRSVEAGRRARSFVANLTHRDLLIVLVSGGASALMVDPIGGLSVEDIREVTADLMRAGAPIGELNSVRRKIDRLKGGGLASATKARIVTLVLSDVIGDDLSAIGSGPTYPDSTPAADVIAVLKRYAAGSPMIVEAIRDVVRGQARAIHHVVIGNNTIALDAAAAHARSLGLHVLTQPEPFTNEARVVGRRFAEALRNYDGPTPACVLAGGESTVVVRGGGRGGRTLEIALAAVRPLAGTHGRTLMAFATDGDDANTGAAGAVVTGATLAQAAAVGLNPEQSIRENDSYHFFEPLDALVRTGPTGTNVNELIIGVVD